MKVYIVTALSESGDHYGPEVYASKPNDTELKTLVEGWDYGNGFGPGDYGSWCHLDIQEVDVVQNDNR